MTDEELAKIEARANAATAGPWARDMYEDGEEGEGPHGVHPGSRGEWVESRDVVSYAASDVGTVEIAAGCYTDADAAFIAAARADVPALVAEVRRLRSGIESAQGHAALLGRVADVFDESRKKTANEEEWASQTCRECAAAILAIK